MNSIIKTIKQWAGLVIFAIFLLAACQSQEETFGEFSSLGETTFIGKADTVVTNSGNEKIRVWVAINADPKIEKGTLKSVNGEITHEFEVVRSENGRDTVTFDLDVAEGEYTMQVILSDANSENQSLPLEFTANVLGPKYIGSLINRNVTSILFDNASESAVISWTDAPKNLQSTALTYNTSDGIEQVITIANADTQTTIDDFKAGGTFNVKSTYRPPNTIEDFVVEEPAINNFPKCNSTALLTLSDESMDFGQVNNGGMANGSFTIQSNDCFLSDISLTLDVSAFFQISTGMAGPFESSLSLSDISAERTIYVQFNANSGRNQVFNAIINVSADNIAADYSISLSGEEIGNAISGIQRHPVEMRSWAGAIFTDDIGITAFGAVVENLWDENNATVIHSELTSIPQGFFTIDLGDDFRLVEISWNGRADCCHDRSPKEYQYWGLPGDVDPSTAITTTPLIGHPENLMDWGRESLAKGWIPLGNFEVAENTTVLKVDEIKTSFDVKYVRMVIVDSFGGTYLSLGTLDFKVDYGN